ncbi:2-hydroxychromene-2-carboxylate isomerase [Vibrio algarum]|uniref:2-hydroxychromene-2-carboxylate isomerase n=1 Tax=Vibrio algarum TaxID=3020714 RepID=A0ABT4YUD8_9VIBR|nr:2-hydroxychromene-2-carboxylate isomerase [Vibrio sp. KJ40-1]MDB1124965.1 2-hydroxychromene-2-carboxylate isomerase [Vibrio sp. KJ40-1]
MSKTINYYFTSISPFTYLGHSLLLQTSEKANAKIHYKPVILGQIFAVNGTLPLGERSNSRQAYRLVELTRWSVKRSLPLILKPAFFPTNPALADKCVIALQESGISAGKFANVVMAACWSQEKNISEETVIHDILTELKFDADTIMTKAKTDEVQSIYEANTAEAIEKSVLGVPAYYFNGEQFWGQDRLELLKDALSK